ncbi:MAG: hypothetical protein JWM11_5411 [Planctomycetaceae bacterium]|nr:hypothetical protein [Planctomycetaceae bacterium]
MFRVLSFTAWCEEATAEGGASYDFKSKKKPARNIDARSELAQPVAPEFVLIQATFQDIALLM